ncbi:MAG: universal stress protein [Proteobacteria bacterium]|nr:universal stress protein [Pseudomonadota bacterium]
MKKFNKIIVACDLSKHSFQAVRHAAELAENLNAEVVIVNVINQRDYMAVSETIAKISAFKNDLHMSAEEYFEEMKEGRAEEINKLIEQAACKHLVEKIIFRFGVPFEELIEAVRKEKADMLVMSTKGRSNLSSLLFGSTAERMFRHCPVPLLIVRPQNP